MTSRDIERLVKHAHRFNSRIFITLNTILRDDELEAARQMAWQVYEAGADALIIRTWACSKSTCPHPAARQHPDRHPHA